MNRHPAGAPNGGQFAPGARDEPVVELTGGLTDAQVAEITGRMVADLRYAGAIVADSGQIGFHVLDVDEVAETAAWSAMGLYSHQDAPPDVVDAARAVIVEHLGDPNPDALANTGVTSFWTDDVHGLCAKVVDAVRTQTCAAAA